MAGLPEDVIMDILTRLPVKSLLRFRCVSSCFLALIDGPDFVKRHLNRSLLTKTNHKLILRECGYWTHGMPYRYIPPSSDHLYSVDFDTLDQALELDHPCEPEIIGSVNGLICLRNEKHDVVFCNFAMRNFHKLPDDHPCETGITGSVPMIDILGQPYASPPIHTIVYGFGYDSVSDDYKLLRLVQLNGNDINFEAKVYSLRSNSWQTIQDFPYYFHYEKGNGQIVSGALHWVVFRKRQTTNLTPIATYMYEDKIIAAFDLARNEYRVIDYPEFLEKGPCDLTTLEGNLCITCSYIVQVDVWVMNDYGVNDSWSKLFSVSQPEVISVFMSVIPLTYSKSRTEIMLLQDSEKLLWYSLEEKTVRTIYLRGCPDGFHSEVCVESLVSVRVKTEDYAKKRIGDGKEKQQIKYVKSNRDEPEDDLPQESVEAP